MFSTVHTIGEFDRRALRAGPCYASPMDFANTVLNAPAGQTAIWHGLRGVNSTVVAGAASGLQALTHAMELIRAGRARAILAGGVEELSHESSSGFRRTGRLCEDRRPLPFDKRSTGFWLGEGACLLLLEDADSAMVRGATIFGRLTGHGSRFDPRRGLDEERAVDTVAGSMRLALEDSDLLADDIDCVSASARGDSVGDRREARALSDVFSGSDDGLVVTAIKAQTGDVLGASGAMQVASLLECMRERLIPGIPGLSHVVDPFLSGKTSNKPREKKLHRCLVNSIGFDGHSCSVVLAAA
jgi:3-oxoacyl-[acyl-carrier-protein] synthase II